MGENMTRSNFEAVQVKNGTSSRGSLIRENVYHVRIVNDTRFQVSIRGKVFGDAVIPSKTERILVYGDASYPGGVNFVVSFGNGHTNTDYVTFFISQTNGI
jgi:hypothetical protein